MMKIIRKSGKFFPENIIFGLRNIFEKRGYDFNLKKQKKDIIFTPNGEKVRFVASIECEKKEQGVTDEWKKNYGVEIKLDGYLDYDLSINGNIEIEVFGSWTHESGDVFYPKNFFAAILHKFFGRNPYLKKLEEYHKSFKQEFFEIIKEIEGVVNGGG